MAATRPETDPGFGRRRPHYSLAKSTAACSSKSRTAVEVIETLRGAVRQTRGA